MKMLKSRLAKRKGRGRLIYPRLYYIIRDEMIRNGTSARFVG